MQDCGHEGVLEGSQVEGLGRGGPRSKCPRGEIVGPFGVSPATVKRWLKKRRDTGDVEAEPIPGPPARKRGALEERLPGQVRLNPDLTLAEHCELFEEQSGVGVSTATMSRAFAGLGLTLKKVPRGLRAGRGGEGPLAKCGAGVDPERLVFVDECGTHTSMTRLRARAPKGERAYGRVARNRGPNTTLLASMTHEGMGPCVAVEGATTKAVFEAYDVEQALTPLLRAGQVVVMDNLAAHKGERVRELVEARGCELLFLPAYSRRTSRRSRRPSRRSRRC